MKLRTLLVYVLLLCLFVPMTAAQDEGRIGEIITVEGEVLEILSPYSFVMTRTEPFDFTPSDVIVFNDDVQPFDVDVNVGRTVHVTGRVEAFNLGDVNNQVGYEVDATLYGDFASDDFIIVASQVTDAESMVMGGIFDTDEATATRIEENPSEFVGQTLTVEGFVADILGPNTFRLENTTPFNLSPSSLLVTNDDMQAFQIDVNRGRRVQVTGTLHAFNFDEINAMTTTELDPTAFEFYNENDYIIIAESVTAIRGATGDDMNVDNNFTRINMGDTITLEGEVLEILSPTSFLMSRTQPFNFTPSDVIVFNDDAQPFEVDVNVGRRVQVTGVVNPLDFNVFAPQLAYEFDTALYGDFGIDDYAIVASQVTDAETLPAAGVFDYDTDTAILIETNPVDYIGQTLTVEGFVTEILGPYTFRLENTTPFDLSPSSLLVTNDDVDPFAVDVNVGRHVRVVGNLQAFNFDEINTMTPYDLDPLAFDFYDENDYIMVAESVTGVIGTTDDLGTTVVDPDPDVIGDMDRDELFDAIEDDPLAYVGMTVTLEGEAAEVYSPNSFLLEEDEFFDLDPMEIPVFSSTAMTFPDAGELTFDANLYLVTGEVVLFNVIDIENEIGLDLDDNLYTDFGDGNIAIIASEVTQIEE